MLIVICEFFGYFVVFDCFCFMCLFGEVLLCVKCVGVCGIDLYIFIGNQFYFDYLCVMGYEFFGVVEEVDVGSGLLLGEVVYVMFYLFCGDCIVCCQGKINCCICIQVLGVYCDGVFIEYVSVL